MLKRSDNSDRSYRAQRLCALVGWAFVGIAIWGATLSVSRVEAAGCRHYAVIGHWQGPIIDRGVPPDVGPAAISFETADSSAPNSSVPGSGETSDCHGPNCTRQVPLLPQQNLRIVLVQSLETYLLAALEMPESFSSTPFVLRDELSTQVRPADLLRPPR